MGGLNSAESALLFTDHPMSNQADGWFCQKPASPGRSGCCHHWVYGERLARFMLAWSVLNVVDNFPVEPISAYLCASVNHPMEIHGISILKKYYGEESKYKL